MSKREKIEPKKKKVTIKNDFLRQKAIEPYGTIWNPPTLASKYPPIVAAAADNRKLWHLYRIVAFPKNMSMKYGGE